MVLGVAEQSKSSEIHLMRATLHYGGGRQRGGAGPGQRQPVDSPRGNR